MGRPDPVAAYIAAHPDRVHQQAGASRARDRQAAPLPRASGLWGWCGECGERLDGGLQESAAVTRHNQAHPGRVGFRVEVRLAEGPDGRFRPVPPRYETRESGSHCYDGQGPEG